MQAMVVESWGEPFVTRQVPDPEPARDEAILRVRAAGVGLTLLNMRSGAYGGQTPRIMGHEIAGDVVAVGGEAGAVRVGDRRAAYFYLTCDACEWCRKGRETLCANHGGYVGVHTDGGFAEYVSLPARNLIAIPGDVTYEAAAITADAINTNWHCMTARAPLKPGDHVLMMGVGGGLGLHGVQLAKAFGAHVIGVDLSEAKVQAAEDWGADVAVATRDAEQIAELVDQVTRGRGVDVAIDYVGAAPTFSACIRNVATSGTAVAIGATPDSVELEPRALLLKEATVTGARHSTRQEFIESLDLVASGAVQPVVGRRVPFTDVESVLADLDDGRLVGRGALTYPA